MDWEHSFFLSKVENKRVEYFFWKNGEEVSRRLINPIFPTFFHDRGKTFFFPIITVT